MKKIIKIGNFEIGKDHYCFIIAEAGVNHNGNLKLAKKLVDMAKEAGADAVKFQTFKTEDVVTKETPLADYQVKNTGKNTNQWEMIKKLEMSYADFEKLKKYCDQKKILFLSTPHTEEAIDFLDKLVPAFKIASGDLTNFPFLEKIAQTKKPLLLSTGMATLEEVKDAVETIEKYHHDFVLFHCTTNYPCPRNNVNLKAMETLRKRFDCLVGYSDHTEGIEIPLLAVSLGAKVIEKHLTLDKNMIGPDHRASLNPIEFKEMTKKIRENKFITLSEEVLGDGIKKPTKSEIEMRKVIRKSVVANRKILKGEKITPEMLTIKRPGTGIEPKNWNEIIGKITITDIQKDELISWEKLK